MADLWLKAGDFLASRARDLREKLAMHIFQRCSFRTEVYTLTQLSEPRVVQCKPTLDSARAKEI